MKRNQKGPSGADLIPGIDIRKEILKVVLGILFIVLIRILIIKLHLNTWQIILLLCIVSFLFNVYKSIKNKQAFSVRSFIRSCIQISLIIILLQFLRLFLGAWAYPLTILLIALFIVIKRWKQYMTIIKSVETYLYGKPMDQFAPGEFKNRPRRKIKIVWGRDHGSKKEV